MLSNKDINFDDTRQILTINGEGHAVGDPSIPGEIDALDERVDALEKIPAEIESLDGRVTALEEAGGGGATVYRWDYALESLVLNGFDKTRVIIANSGVSETGAVYIGLLIGENKINLQNKAAPSGSTPQPGISKTSTGWTIGRMSGQGIDANCIIFEF